MWALAADLIRLSSKRSFLSSEVARDRCARAQLDAVTLSSGGAPQGADSERRQLAKQADTSDQSALAQEKQQLDALTAEFKQLSGVLASVAKQAILLDLYKSSLSTWQGEVASEFKERTKGLLTRILRLAIALGVVFIIGQVWRQTTFRYVHDARRR